MDIRAENYRIREALKALLKQRKISYIDLAAKLNVSLATVKRFLNREDLSLDRLLAICDEMDLKLEELMNEVRARETREAEKVYLTPEQEEFLVHDVRYFSYWNLLRNGRSPESIAKEFKLSSKSQEKYLRELEKMELVTVLPSGKVRAKQVSTPLNPGGPLYAKYLRKTTAAFTDYIVDNAAQPQKLRRGLEEGSIHLDMSDYPLRKETFKQFAQEQKELTRKYYKQYSLESKLGQLEGAGTLVRVEMYYYAEPGDPTLKNFWNAMEDWVKVENL
jgi:transcriptional regulator with XRE-family HTH domain